jgi:hypothetical protein
VRVGKTRGRSVLVHESERRWRVFRDRVERIADAQAFSAAGPGRIELPQSVSIAIDTALASAAVRALPASGSVKGTNRRVAGIASAAR